MIKKLILVFLALALPLVVAVPTYADCGDTKTHLVSCDSSTGTGSLGSIISITLSIMTVLIGIVAVGGLAYAGVIYASARDDQTKVDEAKRIVRNVVIGILLYGFTIAIINWLLPSSVIDGGASSSPSPSASASPSVSASPSSH